MSIYVVTGGAGFIGSHLVETLHNAGETVRVFDNFSTGDEKNLSSVSDSVEIIRGDLRDPESLTAALKGADYVLHHAAQVSAPQSVADPLTTHDVNVTGTLNLLLAAREADVKRVVMASTCAVYGDTDVIPTDESVPAAPLSPYAASKLMGEQYAGTFYRLYGLDVVCLRYFNVYGPKQNPKSQYAAAIPIFIEAVLSGKQPTVYGDGEQTRDFVYVGDVVRANLLACSATEASSRVFNIGSGSKISINNLLAALGTVASKKINPVYVEERPGDIKHSAGNITLAKNVLKFAPNVQFTEGLTTTYDWMAQRFSRK